MDTSNTCIEMCKKARKLGLGDKDSPSITIGRVRIIFRSPIYKVTFSQDQLQEMVKADLKKIGIGLVEGFNLWYRGGELYDLLGDFSLEQAWLCYVMAFKYNKIWDSEKKEWIPLS